MSLFSSYTSALERAGIVTPALIIDRDRLDENCAQLVGDLPVGMGLRIVAKSLPSLSLIEHIRDRCGTDRLMVFNLPMLWQLGAAMPQAGLMLGKPLSEAALQSFLARPKGVDPARVIFLVDSLPRLRAYGALARAAGVALNVALELDVGLHRGGFTGADLHGAVQELGDHSDLRFAGLMGYEAHIPAIPTLFGWQNRVRRAARTAYLEAAARVRQQLGDQAQRHAIYNTGGSPTFRLYGDTEMANEVSVGSALVKPTDFDTPLLRAYHAACYIATPVLKGPLPTRIPGFGRLGAVLPGAGRATLFTHGGKWMADPVFPQGLRYNRLYGRSSNQEMLTGPAGMAVPPWVFYRPHQSEAVLMQFGDLVVISGGQVVDRWPTLPVSA